MKKWGLILMTGVLFSCGKTGLNKESAKAYFDDLSNAEYLAAEDFLSANFVYEDVIFKQEYPGKQEYIQSLVNSPVREYQCDKIIKIEHIDSDNDSMVYVKGEYCGYIYNKNEVSPMRFVSVLYYDDQGKIRRQEDWIDHSFEGILNMYQFRNSIMSSGN